MRWEHLERLLYFSVGYGTGIYDKGEEGKQKLVLVIVVAMSGRQTRIEKFRVTLCFLPGVCWSPFGKHGELD